MLTVRTLQAVGHTVAVTKGSNSTAHFLCGNSSIKPTYSLTNTLQQQTSNTFTQNLTRNFANNLAGSLVDSAINGKPFNEDTFAQAFKSSLITTGMASGANMNGDATAKG